MKYLATVYIIVCLDTNVHYGLKYKYQHWQLSKNWGDLSS